MNLPVGSITRSYIANIKHNWKSGATVALVAMPLSISLAVASGSTPTVGIITAVWAGLIAGLFGGSNFNVVGPTGALSGLIAAYVATNGIDSLASLTIITGALILVAYTFKLERYLFFIPGSVVHGFTLGVAGIIAFNQLNFALGISGLEKHEHFFWNVVETLRHIMSASLPTLLIFSFSLAFLFIFKKVLPKVPGALMLSPFGICLGYLVSTNVPSFHLETLGTVFGHIPFRLMLLPHLEFSGVMLLPAVAIALVAILETMLSARIADNMTHTKHDERKEMFGLGLANMAAGLAGGIPATAALARTALNIKTGATHKVSSVLSALFLALISFLLLSFFRYIPMSVISAILVFVAIQMIERDHFVKLYKFQRSGFWMAITVAAVTFYEDPIVGIIFGVALSLFVFIEKLSRGQFDIKLSTREEGEIQRITGERLEGLTKRADILVYSFKGKLAYLNSRAHVLRFEKNLSQYGVVILRLRSVYFIDLDGVEALDEIIRLIKQKGQEVCLTSLNSDVILLLEQVSTEYKNLKEAGLVFKKSTDALHYFGVHGESGVPNR